MIPCFKVRHHLFGLLAQIGAEVDRIYVVDDCCPDGSGDFVQTHCKDARVRVLRNLQNQGVGGVLTVGYQAAVADAMDIIVKVDGDGQMDPSPDFGFCCVDSCRRSGLYERKPFL